MTYREALSQLAVGISISESPDMPVLGLTEEHLRDAMTEIARHLLALGARLAYGGDLRAYGFTELLFELVARHRRDADEGDERTGVTNYVSWPVHCALSIPKIERVSSEIAGSAELVLLALDGRRLTMDERRTIPQTEPTDPEWAQGLTSMRKVVLSETQARVVLGGRTEKYKGRMPGIAEESFLALQAKQPLFLLGGFGGCTRDIAETLRLVPDIDRPQSEWPNREAFKAFTDADLNNGLTQTENATLAVTPHVDQAIALILRGLLRLNESTPSAEGTA